MSHTNSTPNYNLPQFITTDKPFWLTDVNNAFLAIDTGIDAAKDAADNAQSDATQALTDAGNASTAASTADAKGGGAVASIADAFDSTATYSVGDLVMYNNLLYGCHTAIITPGAWTGSANWSRTTCETAINTLKAQVNNTKENKFYHATLTKTTSGGIFKLNFADVGVSARPSVVIATCQDVRAICTYLFEISTSEINIIAVDPDNHALADGLHRFGIVVFA